MRKRRLFLHCGLPKTGTTAMQMWWDGQRRSMRKLGLDYPNRPKLFEHKHSYLVSDLRRPKGLRRTQRMIARAEQGTGNLLLSNEGLSNHFYEFDAGCLAEFRDLTANFDTTVILFRRDAEAWLTSYHRQAVLNPNPDRDALWGTAMTRDELRQHPRVAGMLDVDTLLDDMCVGFGAQDAELMDFKLPQGFEALLDRLGLGRLATEPLPRINESVPDWTTEFMRRINGSGANERERSAWKALLCRCLGSTHTVLQADAAKVKPADFTGLLQMQRLEFLPPEAPIQRLEALACGQRDSHEEPM